MAAAVAFRLAGLALIWGSSFLFIEVALEGLTPTQVVAGRMIFGALTLAVAVGLGAGRYPRGLDIWRKTVVLTVLGNLAPFLLFAWSQQRVSSSVAGVLNATTPLCTAAVALAAGEERLGRNKLVGLLVGLAGVAVIVRPWDDAAASLPGQLGCIAAAACYALVFVYTRRHISGRVAPVAAAAGQVTTGAVLATAVAGVALLLGEPAPDPGWRAAASVVELGLMGTGIAYLLSFRLVEIAGATTASTVTYLMPVVAVALGVVILDERVTWHLFAGAVLVVAGVALAQRRSEVQPAVAASAPHAVT